MAQMRYLGNQPKILLRGSLGATEIQPGDIVEMSEAEAGGCACCNDGRLDGEWERLPDPEPVPNPLRLPNPEPAPVA